MSNYVPAGFFLLRAPALPHDTFLDFMREPSGTTQKLLDLAAAPEVQRALFVASEGISEGLAHMNRMSPKSLARMHSRLWRYLTRMSTRPTPFGAFSGVAAGTFGRRTSAHLGTPAIRTSRVRADMGWILALIRQLEDTPAMWGHLRMLRNAMMHISGDRVVLPHSDVYGDNDSKAVRVRATPAVTAVLDATAGPTRYQSVMDALSTLFPDVSGEVKDNLLRELWDLHLLTSDLRPPQTSARPEQSLLDVLQDIPAAAETSSQLRIVVDLARRADDEASLAALRTAQEKLVPGHSGQTYQLDASVDLREPYINESVAQAAADAADVLTRLSAATGAGNTHLAQYRDEFVERYGQGARIPILELLSPDQGLDAPPSYTEPPRSAGLLANASPPDTTHIDQVLVEFAQQAWWSRAREVELTDHWLDRLTHDAPSGPLLPVMDLYLQIEAETRRAIDLGEWRAVVRADGLAHGGRTFGRFFDLLGKEAGDHLRTYARREEALAPHAVHAGVSYLPTYGRAANVAVHLRLRSYEIPVNTAPSAAADHVIPLDDILVGTNGQRLYLWSQRLDREVIATQHHMLSPLAAPNVVRFLLEVSHDGYVMPSGFYWGPVSAVPYLPRVTRGSVVLRPAEWKLSSHDAHDVTAWRERWDVPRYVYLVEHDNRLLLDLEHPQCLAEVRDEVHRKGGAVTLLEMLPDFGHSWLKDTHGNTYSEEVVVPLIARSAEVSARSAVGTKTETPSLRHLPGGDWVHLKIYAAFERQDEIITGPLRELITDLRRQGVLERWFYIRYADPLPHLRIRVRSEDPATLHALVQWGNRTVASGLGQDIALESYNPETARYGGTDTFDAVEQLFETNSDATSLLLAQRPRMKDEHLALAVVDTLYRQWGVPLNERTDYLPGHIDERSTREDFTHNRDYLCELLLPWDRYPHEAGREQRLHLAEVFAQQEATAAAAAAEVRQAQGRGRLTVPATHVVGSLAHMQVNRLLPIDLKREERCYGLLRHTLRALRGRIAAGEVQ